MIATIGAFFIAVQVDIERGMIVLIAAAWIIIEIILAIAMEFRAGRYSRIPKIA